VTLDDGTELPADLIVCATGYGSMNEWAAKLISPEVADAVGECWGLGSGTRFDPGLLRRLPHAAQLSHPGPGGVARARAGAPGPGWESCATCGSRRSSPGCGSMAATSCNRATTRSTSRCSSRRGWKRSRRRCTTSIPCITSAEMALAPGLIDAYENADYVVFTDPELVLRIGEPSPR